MIPIIYYYIYQEKKFIIRHDIFYLKIFKKKREYQYVNYSKSIVYYYQIQKKLISLTV